jgi:hypothetical protein
MSKNFGILAAPNPNGTWRWELHVPKGSQQDYMNGFANIEAEAIVIVLQAINGVGR